LTVHPRRPLRGLRSLLLLTGAAFAALLAAAPAAASIMLPLHAAHRGTTAAGFGSHSCDQIPAADRGPNSDGFVFVLPGHDAHFLTLTLAFRTTDGDHVTVSIPNPSDAYPDGITSNGTSKAWVVVPSGWTLLDGTATVDNDKTKADDFNLTHTCVGSGGSPSPSPSPSKSPSVSPSPSCSPSASPPASPSPSHSASPSGSGTVEGSSAASESPSVPGGGGNGGGGGLPVTGVALTGITLTGAAMVAGGAALLFMVRRRNQAFAVSADHTAPEPTSEA
jgi:uncharacterized membrane protein YgcG